VAQVFAPLLGASSERQGAPGRIVNISSIAGKIGMPFLGAYVSSKHAMDGMSESLRREMMVHGIDVIVIAPGSVVTAIWDKAEALDISTYANTEYGNILEGFRKYAIEDGRKGLTPERLGEAVHLALTARQPKAYYAVVPQRFKNFTMPTLLPKRLVDKLIGKQFGLTRASAK
jgi:hypothetical protein